MAENDDFNQKIILAATEREQWYDSTELPKVQENYRLHLSCVRNLFEALVKRGLITPDPYKKDKKITEIKSPATEPFNDNERSQVLGIRLSDYESMVDYVCNYMRFSVEQLSMEKIRKLVELNNTFAWTNLSLNSTKCNTRNFATLVNDLKTGAPQLTLSLIKDSLSKTQTALVEITNSLKALSDFQRERYKIDIRKNILENPSFDKGKAYSSAGSLTSEIKKMFPGSMGRRAFNAELVGELVNEELAQNKNELREKLYEKIHVVEESKKSVKEQVNTHEILMDSLRVLGTSADQYNLILEKVIGNSDLLQSEHNTFKDKFLKFIRQLFGIEEKSVSYEVTLTDKRTGVQKKELVHINEFVSLLSKRIKNYSSFSTKEGTGYARVNAQPDQTILDYLNKQAVENNHSFALLTALDEYFKSNASPVNRSKIKGVSMELTTIKNIIVRSNQIRAEYAAYVEEQEQMKKLGIS